MGKFQDLWGVSSVGPLKFYLGMEVDYVKGHYINISQRAYFEKVLKRFGYDKMKKAETPMDSTFKITVADSDGDEALDEADKKRYMEIVGSLIYGAVHTRADIANAVGQLGRVMSKPGKKHMKAAIRVLRYIAGTLDRGLHYENKSWQAPGIVGDVAPGKVVAYTDSDWAGDEDTRKSTSAYAVFLAGGPISYRSSLQKIQALSSAEAEYVALSDGSREVQYIAGVLNEIGLIDQGGPIPVYSDSSAAIAMTQNKGVSHRTKHIAMRYHHVKTLVEDKVIAVNKIITDANPADILTKATDNVTFIRHANLCTPLLQLQN